MTITPYVYLFVWIILFLMNVVDVFVWPAGLWPLGALSVGMLVDWRISTKLNKRSRS